VTPRSGGTGKAQPTGCGRRGLRCTPIVRVGGGDHQAFRWLTTRNCGLAGLAWRQGGQRSTSPVEKSCHFVEGSKGDGRKPLQGDNQESWGVTTFPRPHRASRPHLLPLGWATRGEACLPRGCSGFQLQVAPRLRKAGEESRGNGHRTAWEGFQEWPPAARWPRFPIRQQQLFGSLLRMSRRPEVVVRRIPAGSSSFKGEHVDRVQAASMRFCRDGGLGSSGPPGPPAVSGSGTTGNGSGKLRPGLSSRKPQASVLVSARRAAPPAAARRSLPCCCSGPGAGRRAGTSAASRARRRSPKRSWQAPAAGASRARVVSVPVVLLWAPLARALRPWPLGSAPTAAAAAASSLRGLQFCLGQPLPGQVERSPPACRRCRACRRVSLSAGRLLQVVLQSFQRQLSANRLGPGSLRLERCELAVQGSAARGGCRQCLVGPRAVLGSG